MKKGKGTYKDGEWEGRSLFGPGGAQRGRSEAAHS
jgi:hypothetical protein